jgi:hypothetical protein
MYRLATLHWTMWLIILSSRCSLMPFLEVEVFCLKNYYLCENIK